MIITKKSSKAIILSIFFMLPIIGSAFLAPSVRADESLAASQVGLEEVGRVYGGEKLKRDPRELVASYISFALGFISIIFLALTIAAGFQYMTSGGNAESAGKAASNLKNAIIGLLIVLAAWSVSRFTIVMLNRATRGDDTSYYDEKRM